MQCSPLFVTHTRPSLFEPGRRHLPISDVAMQKHRVPQPQVEPLPVEVGNVPGQVRQAIDQFVVVVVIAQQKVNVAVGHPNRQIVQPVDRRVDRCPH